MSTAKNYYLWAEGQERGPITRDELERMWKSGDLPRGALWRKDGVNTFNDPSDLGWEFAPPPMPMPPAVPSLMQQLRPLGLDGGSLVFGIIFLFAGCIAATQSTFAGGTLVALGMTCFIGSWGTAVLRGVSETRQILGHISEQLAEIAKDRRADRE